MSYPLRAHEDFVAKKISLPPENTKGPRGGQ